MKNENTELPKWEYEDLEVAEFLKFMKGVLADERANKNGVGRVLHIDFKSRKLRSAVDYEMNLTAYKRYF